MWGEEQVSDSQLYLECERAETHYLAEQQQEWGSISDGDLLGYVLQIESEMEGKRIAELETENTCGIHRYSILLTLILIRGIYRF